MKNTHLIALILALLGYFAEGSSHAQNANFSNDGIAWSSGEVHSSNSRLLKELRRTKSRSRKQLARQYPDATEQELDSLVAVKKAELKSEREDSSEGELNELKKGINEGLVETPEKLPVANELRKSMAELEDIEAMHDLSGSSFSVGDLRRLNKHGEALLEDVSQYKAQFQDWDRALLSSVENIPEAQLAKQQLDRINAYEPLPQGYRDNLKQFQTNDFIKDKLELKSDELEKIGETLQDRFDNAMEAMQEAKSEFPELENVEEAPKRYNPYKGTPFLKRIKYGGNLNYNPAKPVSIDLAASAIYPFNKRWSLGLEGAGRIRLQKAESSILSDKQYLWSYRGLSRYQLTNTFFLQANYEASRFKFVETQDSSLAYNWYQTVLVGLGKQFVVKEKIKLNVIMFYDVLYRAPTSPYNKPFIIRLGFAL